MEEAKTSSRPGSSTVGWTRPGVIEATFRGHLTAAEVDRVIAAAEIALRGRPAGSAVIDTSGMTGFSADVRRPASRFLTLLRTAGVRKCVAIIPLAAARMLAMALTLGLGLDMKVFPSRAEAQATIDALPTAPAPTKA